MRMPSDKALNVALLWLELNEGGDGEREQCQEVMRWIEHEWTERQIKNGARAAGVTTAVFRRRLADKEKVAPAHDA